MLRQRRFPSRARRGVILVVVLGLLTLFAVLGITFVLYADAEAASARQGRDAQSASRAHVEPELLLAYFLGPLLYDAKDDGTGVSSGLRGHSLARSMYGYDDEDSNLTPFNGVGRLHTGPGAYANPYRIDDSFLINYTYFPADGFLRDPERLGARADPAQPRGPFTGGCHAPHTHPHLNNMFPAARQAHRTPKLPSLHPPSTGFPPPPPHH